MVRRRDVFSVDYLRKWVEKRTYVKTKKVSDNTRNIRRPVRPVINLTSKIKMCRECYETPIVEANKKRAEYWFDQFNKSEAKSIRDFVRTSDFDKSHVSFIKLMKKYIPEFETVQGKDYKPNQK